MRVTGLPGYQIKQKETDLTMPLEFLITGTSTEVPEFSFYQVDLMGNYLQCPPVLGTVLDRHTAVNITDKHHRPHSRTGKRQTRQRYIKR